MTVNKFLVRKLSLSNDRVLVLIKEKKVVINGLPAKQGQLVTTYDTIVVENSTVYSPPAFLYIAYYKPKGIECSLNPNIEEGLASVLPFSERVFPVGRLDKESEGLLLLTNDGKVYKEIAGEEVLKEKEYLVRTDKTLTEEALNRLRNGVVIMGKKTRPAVVEKIDEYTFQITLTQGLNRQIRRMCYKLGYNVDLLKRIRIMSIQLGSLESGEFKYISREDLFKDYKA